MMNLMITNVQTPKAQPHCLTVLWPCITSHSQLLFVTILFCYITLPVIKNIFSVFYYFCIHGNNKLEVIIIIIIIISLLVLADAGKIGTLISVIIVENADRINVAANSARSIHWTWCSLHVAKLLHETQLLLGLVASPWYRSAKCQPSSTCGNSKGKCSDAMCPSFMCSILKLWCHIMSFMSHNILSDLKKNVVPTRTSKSLVE